MQIAQIIFVFIREDPPDLPNSCSIYLVIYSSDDYLHPLLKDFLYFYIKNQMDLSELYHKKSSFAARNVGTEIILVPVKNSVADMNELFTLNEVGSFIWNHIDGEKSENDIVKALIVDFNVDEERAIKDVKEFIESLKALIEKS